QYRGWTAVLRPARSQAGVRILPGQPWAPRQRRCLRAYFRNNVMPVLSPLGLDPSHPFPRILHKSLIVVVVLEGMDAFGRPGHLAIVRAPRSLNRIVELPASLRGKNEQAFVLLSSMLAVFVDELFPGMTVRGAYQFRVT